MASRIAAFMAAGAVSFAGAQVLGTKPGYLSSEPSAVANEQAVTRSMWAPGLDEGYVPQGVAVDSTFVFISAYRSTDPRVGTGPCRIFRMEAATGRPAGGFDLPTECGHAGGLASIGDGTIVVSDTRRLYRIALDKALASGKAEEEALTSTVSLAGALRGSFAAFDGKDLWIGTYSKDPSQARLHRLPLAIFDEFNGRTITEEKATAAIAIPTHAQGAAFDRAGALWLSSSSSQHGRLFRLDRRSGAVLAEHELAIGVEGLAFDGEGGLWTVSEAGSRRWIAWRETYPLVFRLQVERLR